MIALNDVSKTFFRDKSRVEALKNVTLEIGRGEIFGVIGYSGAGKSTLLRCMNMLEQPTSGTVMVNGVKLTELPETELQKSRRKIGMIFQHFNLLSSSTVFSNVAAPLRLVHTPQAEIDHKVFELLELVGLTEQAQAYPAQLSGGQKQRVGIARALANEPEILLCDEATSALDPETTDSILDLLLAINQRLHLTIVFVTHEMHVVQKICDRVAIMEHGEVIEQGKVLDLFTRPQTPTAKKFIGTIVDTRVPDKIFNLLQQETGFFQLVRIGFVGEDAGKPLLAELALHFQIQPNILYGNIIEIKDTICGNLIVQFTGQQERISQALKFLVGSGLQIEFLFDGSSATETAEKRSVS